MGPASASVDQRPRWAVVSLLAVGLVILIVVCIWPTLTRQHQYSELRAHGVTTVAVISFCATAENNRPATVTITCPGTFVVGATKVREDILGLEQPLPTGARVTVIVDPHDPRTVYPLMDVRDNVDTGWLTSSTAVAGIAVVILLLLIWRQRVVLHARRATPAGSTSSTAPRDDRR